MAIDFYNEQQMNPGKDFAYGLTASTRAINSTNAKFKVRYMSSRIHRGEINKESLFGLSYAKLGASKQPVSTLNELSNLEKLRQLKENGIDVFAVNFELLDLNNDGNADIPEMSAYNLLNDMFDVDTGFNTDNIDGIITEKGQKRATILLSDPQYEKKAKVLLKQLYNHFDLGEDKAKP